MLIRNTALWLPGGGAPPPDPTFNAGGTPAATGAGTTHDIVVNLGSGTNRRALVCGLFQNASGTFSAGTFDFGGDDVEAMTAVGSTPIVNAGGTRIVLGAYHFAIPNEVEAGNKTLRLTTSVSIAIAIMGYAWNNIGAGNPTVGTPFNGVGAQPTPINVTAAAEADLVVSILGINVNQNTADWAPTTGPITTRDLFGMASAGDILLALADGLATGAGTVNAGWTRGAGTPGGTIDIIAHGLVFPHL